LPNVAEPSAAAVGAGGGLAAAPLVELADAGVAVVAPLAELAAVGLAALLDEAAGADVGAGAVVAAGALELLDELPVDPQAEIKPAMVALPNMPRTERRVIFDDVTRGPPYDGTGYPFTEPSVQPDTSQRWPTR
jgi:hypothetical protein